MGEILGFVVGGWLWVGLGRLVARKGAAGDRVLLAGVVAVLAMGALAWFSASTGAAGDRLPEMVAGVEPGRALDGALAQLARLDRCPEPVLRVGHAHTR